MHTPKVIFSIMLLATTALRCMEQKQAPVQQTSDLKKIESIKQEDIKSILYVDTAEFFGYHATLSNGKCLIAKKDRQNHIYCCRSSFPFEEELFGLEETELPTHYFSMLEELFKRQVQQ
jgi:hypothetical protein